MFICNIESVMSCDISFILVDSERDNDDFIDANDGVGVMVGDGAGADVGVMVGVGAGTGADVGVGVDGCVIDCCGDNIVDCDVGDG